MCARSAASARPTTARTLVSAAGPGYFPLAAAARLPYAMMIIGVLTLVVAVRGSVALGGAASASFGIGTALCGPLIGVAADRLGQRPVLLITGAASTLSLLLLTWVIASPAPDVAVLAVTVLLGATTPQIPAMSRSRLIGLITRHVSVERRAPVTNSAMAFESGIDEITYVFGPVIVGALASTLGPAWALWGAAILTVTAIGGFALHPSAAASAPTGGAAPAQAPARELLRFGLLLSLAGVIGVGVFFGASLTSLTAFMEARGQAEQAGLVYGAMGVGSAVCALLTGALPVRFTLPARWVAFALLSLVGAWWMHVAASVWTVAAALLLLGVAIGPLLVTLYSLVARYAPQGRMSTAMNMAATAIVVGQASAAAVTGQVAERWGAGTATLMPLLASAIVLATAAAHAVRSRA